MSCKNWLRLHRRFELFDKIKIDESAANSSLELFTQGHFLILLLFLKKLTSPQHVGKTFSKRPYFFWHVIAYSIMKGLIFDISVQCVIPSLWETWISIKALSCSIFYYVSFLKRLDALFLLFLNFLKNDYILQSLLIYLARNKRWKRKIERYHSLKQCHKVRRSSLHSFGINLTLTRPNGLPPHAPVAQKVAEQRTLIASLVKRLFVRVDWTERLRDDSSTTDWVN